MVQWFSKPPPSATRPPLRVLKPLENHGFPVNSENAVGAVGAAYSGSRRYKKANSAFLPRSGLEWLGLILTVLYALALIVAATAVANLLVHAPHCRPFPSHSNYVSPTPEMCLRQRRVPMRIGDLVLSYITDPDSPFHRLRYVTRQNYGRQLARIVTDIGDRRLEELTVRDVLEAHRGWGAGGKVAMAHSLATTLRIVLSFGSAVMEDPGIDHRRWLTKEGGWLVIENGRYVIGRELPDFKAQHPRVYGEIAADADKWMLKTLGGEVP